MHSTFDLHRRTFLSRALVLLGTPVATGFSFEALAKAVAAPTRYLSPGLFALLESVSDTIVPQTDTAGALAANVPKTVDALIQNWASSPRRYELTQALVKIDRKSQEQYSRSFTALSADERLKLLVEIDKAAHMPAPIPPGGRKPTIMEPAKYADPGFAKLKELILQSYYLSEPALTQELTYEHAPGEWKPSIPVTPQTRATGGTLF